MVCSVHAFYIQNKPSFQVHLLLISCHHGHRQLDLLVCFLHHNFPQFDEFGEKPGKHLFTSNCKTLSPLETLIIMIYVLFSVHFPHSHRL